MIIIRMLGGLGNQLFQYAAGKCLAHRRQTELKLDLSAFTEDKLRDFDLSGLQVTAGFASENDTRQLLPSHTLEKAFQYLRPPGKRTYYREPFFHFDENFVKLGSHVLLKGYFQSEKYFTPVKDIIRKEFVVKPELIGGVTLYGQALLSENSVAVHIRRGDYTDKPLAEYHGILPVDYYTKAIDLVKEKLFGVKFYFFSDHINWVKENLPIPGATYVSGEISKNHFEDLYLMSQCRHHIIANSSFSWWGAWLNTNPGKIVIAPKQWFNKGPKDTQDLVPEGWMRI
jgi:Glycosyl transferase family 11